MFIFKKNKKNSRLIIGGQKMGFAPILLLGGACPGCSPQSLRLCHQLVPHLVPNILVCPPHIFGKSTPVEVVLTKTEVFWIALDYCFVMWCWLSEESVPNLLTCTNFADACARKKGRIQLQCSIKVACTRRLPSIIMGAVLTRNQFVNQQCRISENVWGRTPIHCFKGRGWEREGTPGKYWCPSKKSVPHY